MGLHGLAFFSDVIYTQIMANDPIPIRDEIKTVRYNTKEAFEFYRKFIYNVEHQAILAQHNFHVAGSVPSVNWEVFAAILTGDEGKDGYGSDLNNHEVKSSVGRSSFEYQYHLNGGKTKLKDDMEVNHIFISYSPDYKDVEVRLVAGKLLQPIFESWLPGLIENYEGPNRRQRYRKSIPYGAVEGSGLLILKTKDGGLIENI